MSETGALSTLDLGKKLEPEVYSQRLLECQLKLRELALELYRRRRSLIMVVEGWDAAGKGGAIRRLTEKIDPRGYQVYGIAAPTEEENSRHYLWRFWNRLKARDDKQIVIFDRSWYGRVLVERVEGLVPPEVWRRGYGEINDFERQLTDHGAVLVKLWFHIGKEEQLRRFEARRSTPHKAWKLTDEDWRNRSRWEAYEEAVEDMLAETWTERAPWTLIEGNDKRWARVRTQETLIDRLEAALEDET